MRVTHDRDTDMAYVYVKDPIEPGEAVRNIAWPDGENMPAFILDLDAEGRLLGIEVFGASERLHPSVLEGEHPCT